MSFSSSFFLSFLFAILKLQTYLRNLSVPNFLILLYLTFSRTLLIGSGSPPADFLSPLVIVMMAIGLGVPLLLLMVGGVYVCIRKRVSPANYEPIN